LHQPPAAAGVVLAGHQAPAAELPPPPAPPPSSEATLTLDGVLRLADERNAQIARAQASVEASEAADVVANHTCVPNALRPESHRRAQADAKVWQERNELARVRSEVLQDAGTTYVDWLTALRAEAIQRELEKKEEQILSKAQALARDEKGVTGLVEGIQSSLRGRRQAIVRLQQQAEAAAAKLAYLIHQAGPVALPPSLLEPVDLVDATAPVDDLIRQVLETGPGVQELRGLQAAIEKALAEAHGLETICHLTGCCSICARLREAEARLREVQLAREDLAGKLVAGVREARSAILSGREQITLGGEQIRHAAESHKQSNIRLNDTLSGPNINDVLGSLRGLDAAYSGYLQAVAAYNKAEVRLAVLLGWNGGCKNGTP
jgi:outer membrane protein TolC